MWLRKFEPFETEIAPLEEAFERFFGNKPARSSRWVPSADIWEEDENLFVSLDVPGLKEDDFSIEVKDDSLLISGQRSEESSSQDNEGKFQHRERYFGSFQRWFTLPKEVDQEGITAEYKNGVLKLTLPKSERTKPRQISVKSEA